MTRIVDVFHLKPLRIIPERNFIRLSFRDAFIQRNGGTEKKNFLRKLNGLYSTVTYKNTLTIGLEDIRRTKT